MIKAVFLILLTAVMLDFAINCIQLLRLSIGGTIKLLRSWNVDWLRLTGTLILGGALASQSWEVMFGVLICMYLVKEF